MITIISATNRPASRSLNVARYYELTLKSMGQEVQLLSLEQFTADMFHPMMYAGKEHHLPAIQDLQTKYLIEVDKFIFVCSEYNGSYPGVLKMFLDVCSVWRAKDCFFMKKAALVGVADGRAGNLRGLEHLTGVLNYLGVVILPNRLPISKVASLLKDNELVEEDTQKAIAKQLDQFLAF